MGYRTHDPEIPESKLISEMFGYILEVFKLLEGYMNQFTVKIFSSKYILFAESYKLILSELELIKTWIHCT